MVWFKILIEWCYVLPGLAKHPANGLRVANSMVWFKILTEWCYVLPGLAKHPANGLRVVNSMVQDTNRVVLRIA
ncbi:hypothetical protein RRG08_050946 [Elysia crispata]|uniref:Uncharacterized protein n=1 Tax=Elysia crispata TaxID=231223 RepID=A0AAE0YS31_9GAST|nr:hypothetical protein RRG08_050946 [Elysia crispata]